MRALPVTIHEAPLVLRAHVGLRERQVAHRYVARTHIAGGVQRAHMAAPEHCADRWHMDLHGAGGPRSGSTARR